MCHLLLITNVRATGFLCDVDIILFMVWKFWQATWIFASFDSDLFKLSPPCPCVVLQDSADSSFPWQQHDVVCSATMGKLFSSSSMS